MISTLLKKIFGDKNSRSLKELWPIVEEINLEYEKLQNLTDTELKAKTQEFKDYIQSETEGQNIFYN